MFPNLQGFNLLKELYKKYPEFNKLLNEHLKSGLIRFFDENEFNKIRKQNFISPMKEITSFMDIFALGYNIGDCVGVSKQLSYSYASIDIVSGILPLLKGTRNAEKEGGHCWLETKTEIIDTSLMLVIDKSLKSIMGYQEEIRKTASALRTDPIYTARKEFTLDESLKKPLNY